MKYRLWMTCLCVIGMFCVSGCGRTSVKVTEAVRTDVPFVFETKVAAEPLHVFPVVPMVSGKVVSDMPDVGQVVAAVLVGAVGGDHVSPISDTTGWTGGGFAEGRYHYSCGI